MLRLRRKLGHQRAIAVGLCHVAESVDANTITVMDGDGQDAPATSRGWWQRQENIGAKGSSSQKAGAGRRASCCVSSTIIIAWFTDS